MNEQEQMIKQILEASVSGLVTWVMNQTMEDKDVVFDPKTLVLTTDAVVWASVKASGEEEQLAPLLDELFEETLYQTIKYCASSSGISGIEWISEHVLYSEECEA